jgi:hypothetical protein
LLDYSSSIHPEVSRTFTGPFSTNTGKGRVPIIHQNFEKNAGIREKTYISFTSLTIEEEHTPAGFAVQFLNCRSTVRISVFTSILFGLENLATIQAQSSNHRSNF